MTTAVGGVEVLRGSDRETFDSLVQPGEQVLFCVQNQNPRPDWQRMQTVELSLTEHGALVALDSRLVFIHVFGPASCRYDEITDLDVYRHEQRPIPCLWVNTRTHPMPFSETTLSFLFDQEAQQAHPYHFFIDQKSFSLVEPYIAQLKAQVRAAQAASTPSAEEDLVAWLERLARLHHDGHLNDDEFEAAKRKLLGS
jgi:hypothetical protein